MTTGTVYGLGVGPGDPELITLKALRHLRAARAVAYPVQRGDSVARAIVAAHLREGQVEIAIKRSREAIGLKPDAPISLDVYPRPKSQIERVFDLLTLGGAQLRDGVRALAPVARAVKGGGVGGGEALRMPETGLGR